jgi:hypothetical protein
MAVQIQFRRGTASEWSSANPTLAAGEIGVETDTSKLKIGDGSTSWTSLSYLVSPDPAPVAYTAVNTQSGTTYTFALGDEEELTSFTSSSAVTATIPATASVGFSVGSRLDVLQKGTGTVSLTGDVGVTVNTSMIASTRVQYSVISAIKVASDEWVVIGDLAVV